MNFEEKIKTVGLYKDVTENYDAVETSSKNLKVSQKKFDVIYVRLYSMGCLVCNATIACAVLAIAILSICHTPVLCQNNCT